MRDSLFLKYTTVSLPEFLPRNQSDIEKFASSVFATAKFIESETIPQLMLIYGKTPDWYVYGIDG